MDNNQMNENQGAPNVTVNVVNEQAPQQVTGTGSLVCGILGIVCGLGIILGPIAFFLALGDKKKNNGVMPGKSKAGLICGIIAFIIPIIVGILMATGMVGVMAPQLVKYTGKTQVSSDKQICDTVATAIMTVSMDPDVINDGCWFPEEGDYYLDDFFWEYGDTAREAFEDIVGTDVDDVDDLLKGEGHYGSNADAGICVHVSDYNSFTVYIPNSCASGNGRSCNYDDEIKVEY